jgi:cell wall-associated NlpC family hydrolase
VTGGLVLAMAPTAGAVGPPAAAPAPTAVTPAAVTTTVLAKPARWHTIRYGARGAMVRKIQRVVGAHPDGVFGPRTLRAVKRWQSRHHMVRDGIVGPRTAATMRLVRHVAKRVNKAPARHTTKAPSRSLKRKAPVNSIVSIAKRYTGIYYRFGGTTPRGFDCSGFTQFVYRKAGVNLPRTAAGQQRRAHRVAHPRPGDLVFFGYPAHHVGIYAGPGQMFDSGKPGLRTQKRHIFSGVSGFGRV